MGILINYFFIHFFHITLYAYATEELKSGLYTFCALIFEKVPNTFDICQQIFE